MKAFLHRLLPPAANQSKSIGIKLGTGASMGFTYLSYIIISMRVGPRLFTDIPFILTKMLLPSPDQYNIALFAFCSTCVDIPQYTCNYLILREGVIFLLSLQMKGFGQPRGLSYLRFYGNFCPKIIRHTADMFSLGIIQYAIFLRHICVLCSVAQSAVSYSVYQRGSLAGKPRRDGGLIIITYSNTRLHSWQMIIGRSCMETGLICRLLFVIAIFLLALC